jgi:hypothetical protein
MNTSKNNVPLSSPMSSNKVVDIRPSLFSRQTFIALLATVALAAVVGLLFWEYTNVAADPIFATDADLSNLFTENPANAMGDGDFFDLRDPACTKSFSLHLLGRVFMQMSRNCKYSLHVWSGEARINFLNTSKGFIDLTGGRTWSANDFWSIRPVTREADVRLVLGIIAE